MKFDPMILQNTVDPTAIKGLLKAKFLHAAREALLFLRMEKVEARVYNLQGKEEDLWTVTSSKSEPDDSDTEKGQRVATSIDEAGAQSQDLWYIVTSTFPRHQLPQEFKALFESYRIPSSIKTGIAAYLPTGRPSSAQRQQFLYSTLRLPIHISLPVHLNAPFILAPDRRSIRFDGVGELNLESKFNSWLLVHLIPPLYCHLLGAGDKSLSFQDSLWPRNTGRANESLSSLTSIVADAFFKYFPTSRRPICWTTSGRQLAPRSSRFVGELPGYIDQLLSSLRIDDIVLIPDSRVRARILSSGVRKIDRDDLFPILKQNNDALAGLFESGRLKIEDIWSILQYLTTDNSAGQKLNGLRILPLEDNTLGYLASTGAKVFVRSHYPKQFGKQRFVNRHIPSKLALSLINLGLNVSRFDKKALRELMMERLPKANRIDLTDDRKKWVDSIWDLGDDAGTESLVDFPVVPTSKRLTYISVEEALGERVLFCAPGLEGWIVDCLVDAGATCVTPSLCHPSLRGLLSGKKTLFSQVLNMSAKGFLQIASLNELTRRNLSLWLQNQIQNTTLLQQDQVKARQLPIWTSFNRDGEEHISKASDIYMLPQGLKKNDARPFLLPNIFFTEYSSPLSRILDPSRGVTSRTLHKYIRLPDVIGGSLIGPFKEVLRILIQGGGRDLRVPNTHGNICPVGNLYSTFTELFVTAFRNRPELFLHQDLRDMDSQLRRFDLRYQHNAENFVECASAIHEERLSGDILPRARVLYHIYNTTEMAFHIRNNDYSHRLRDLCFIPRASERREGATYGNQYAIPLPMVVSLNQVLLEEFESLAWSQRARFEQAPTRVLLAVEEGLGKPSISEIVNSSHRSIQY
jgi:hypothetical protein